MLSNTTIPSSILSLPSELVLVIFNYVNDYSQLLKLRAAFQHHKNLSGLVECIDSIVFAKIVVSSADDHRHNLHSFVRCDSFNLSTSNDDTQPSMMWVHTTKERNLSKIITTNQTCHPLLIDFSDPVELSPFKPYIREIAINPTPVLENQGWEEDSHDRQQQQHGGMKFVEFINSLPSLMSLKINQTLSMNINVPIRHLDIGNLGNLDYLNLSQLRTLKSQVRQSLDPYDLPLLTDVTYTLQNLNVNGFHWSSSGQLERLNIQCMIGQVIINNFTNRYLPCLKKISITSKMFAQRRPKLYLVDPWDLSTLTHLTISQAVLDPASPISKILNGTSNLQELKLDNVDLKSINYLNLSEFTKLKKLCLSSNPLPNFEGIELAGSDLEYLEIKHCKVTEIPKFHHDGGHPPLTSQFPKLHTVNFSDSQISKIRNLQTLTNLKSLNLSLGNISEVENLESLINLEELIVSTNQISKIDNIRLPKLKVLNLANNFISRIENLDQAPMLQQLDLSNNRISRIENLDFGLSNLEVLSLNKNKLIKDIGRLQHLKKLKKLGLARLGVVTGSDAINKITKDNTEVEVELWGTIFEDRLEYGRGKVKRLKR
ncbi:hypothetical protein DASC09_040870 [Saccharomycopsis crataegensis]|uniref:F-box domain-containing protein n=1 Tax=Saccharomycopsis crataegensis TaxID=43959 RepID=A0AAV5QPK1_9ASCO|nr:hypothetical protein DASC09_040870 [Saccharomycopsis crataegensis]